MKYWTYHSNEPTPTVADLPPGVFKGTQHQFEQLSPGMRREILRSAGKVRPQTTADIQKQLKDGLITRREAAIKIAEIKSKS